MCLTLAVIFLAGLRAEGGGGGGGCGGGYRVSHGYTKLSRLGGGGGYICIPNQSVII